MGFFDKFKKKQTVTTAVKSAHSDMGLDPPPMPSSAVSQNNSTFGNYGVGTSGVLSPNNTILKKNFFDKSSGDLLEVPLPGQQIQSTASAGEAFSFSSAKEPFSLGQSGAHKEDNFSYSGSGSFSQETGQAQAWPVPELIPKVQDFSLPQVNQLTPVEVGNSFNSSKYAFNKQFPKEEQKNSNDFSIFATEQSSSIPTQSIPTQSIPTQSIPTQSIPAYDNKMPSAMEKLPEPVKPEYKAFQALSKVQIMGLDTMPEKQRVNDIEKVLPFSSKHFKSNMEIRKLIDDEISSVEYMRTGVKPKATWPNYEQEKNDTSFIEKIPNEEMPIEKDEKPVSLDGQSYINIMEFREVINAMNDISNDCRIGEQTIARIEELNHNIQEFYNSWQQYIETFENDIIILEKIIYKK